MRTHPWVEPGVIVSFGKHCTLYYDATSVEEFDKSALAVLISNIEYGMYTDYQDRVQAELIVSGEKPIEAWRFLKSRSNYEYEGISYEVFNK